MKTNDLRKGASVRLANGWFAKIADNARGNIRMAEVDGLVREIVSVYSHDITQAYNPQADKWEAVEHTPAQVKLRTTVARLGF